MKAIKNYPGFMIEVSDITGGMPTIKQQVDSILVHIKAYCRHWDNEPEPELEELRTRYENIQIFFKLCRKYNLNKE